MKPNFTEVQFKYVLLPGRPLWLTLIKFPPKKLYPHVFPCMCYLSSQSLFVALLRQELGYWSSFYCCTLCTSLSIKASDKCPNAKCEMLHNGEVPHWNYPLFAQTSVGDGYIIRAYVGGCAHVTVRARATYGPDSTRRERTLSIPMSHTFMHSPVISMQRPWKFSWS